MDLAKREVRLKAQPQSTFRRETTMPRANTDLPGLEVNAPITRADMSGADELSRILGLASSVGQNIAHDIQEGKDKEAAAQGTLDFSTGSKDETRFAKSFAYRNAWQKEGAKKLALDVSQEVTDEVNAALNNEDKPPTIEDINAIVESVFVKHTHDERGQLLDFGTPEAKTILGNALAEVKATIMPYALKAIKDHTDERFLATKAANGIYEQFVRGAPIGVPVRVEVKDRDPLAPLDGPEAPRQAPVALRTATPSQRTVATVLSASLPAPVVAGFLGNFHIEDGYHGARGDGGVAAGIAQWHPDRQANFLRVIGKPVSQASHAEQAKFVLWEMQHPEQAGMTVAQRDAILKAKTPAKAAELIDKYYERSSGEHRHRRIAAANRFGGDMEDNTATLGDEPELVTEAPSTVPQVQRPPFDFEGLMKDLPPSISRAKAKSYFLQALIAEAAKNDDPSILNGLEESTRKDGTPSFDPGDIAKIVSARDQLAEKARTKAEKAEKDMQAENADRIFEALLGDTPPSKEFIRQAANKRLIDPSFGYSVIHSLEAEERAEERMQVAEDRQAAAEAEADIDADVGTIIAERNAGIGETSVEHDRELFQSGKLGEGRRAITRFRQLRAAATVAGKLRADNPLAVRFSKALELNFKPRTQRSSGTAVERARGAAGASSTGDAVAYAAMVNAYNHMVQNGANPGEAYLKVTTQYGPKGNPETTKSKAALLRLMQQRRLQAGR